MKNVDRFRSVCLGIVCLGWIGVSALGTGGPSARSAAERPHESSQNLTLDHEIRAIIYALHEAQLLDALDLPPDRAQRLTETIHHARHIRQAYQRQRAGIEHRLTTLLHDAPPDLSAIQQTLQELGAAKSRYYQQALQADQTLWNLLSPDEQARYILFQRQFTQQLHDLIIRIRQERKPPSPSGPSEFLLRRHDDESVIRQPRE
jgi:hypothetical protein